MSAIFGIINLDGKPVSIDDIDHMKAALSHRGPDGAGVWHEGPVALGHQMMHITPESLNETLPFYDAEADLAITADARIDNRDDLFSALEIPHEQRAALPDSSLILKAYEKWGEACPTHLLGDFVFVIWDGRQRKLVGMTDHMGRRSLAYYHTPQRFVFASEIKGILAVQGIPKRLNVKKLAYRAFPASNPLHRETTFFDGVLLMHATTVMTVGTNGLKMQSYWDPSPDVRLGLKSDDEILEAFQEVFFQAVKARLRSHFPVTALLSGGLDSSAVVAAAAHLLKDEGKRLTTLSAVLPDGAQSDAVDERYYIDQFCDWENIDMEYINLWC